MWPADRPLRAGALNNDEAGQLAVVLFGDPAGTSRMSEEILQLRLGVCNRLRKADLVQLMQPGQVSGVWCGAAQPNHTTGN